MVAHDGGQRQQQRPSEGGRGDSQGVPSLSALGAGGHHATGGSKVVQIVTQRLISIAIEELKQPETISKIKDHILAPLVRLIYAQIYPYLIVAAVVVLCALVMWVLMFLMFTMSYFRRS